MLYATIRYTSVPLVISLVILYLTCFIPTGDIPEVTFEFFIPIDKLVHFCMFFGLSGATAINYIHGERGNINLNKLIVWVFLLPILYGGFIELLQHYYFPLRSGDWSDFMADALGSLAALPIALYFKNYLKKKQVY